MQSLTVEEDDVFFDSFEKTPTDSSPLSRAVDEKEELEFRQIDSDFWKNDVMSVHERRKRFFLGMGFDEFVSPVTKECDHFVESVDLKRNTESSGAVLDSMSFPDDVGLKDPVCCTRDLDSEQKLVIHDLGQDGLFSMLKGVGSNKLTPSQEFEALLGLSHSLQKFLRKEAAPFGEKHDGGLSSRIKKPKGWWRRFLPNKPFLVGMCNNDVSIKNSNLPMPLKAKFFRHKKKCSEFMALNMGQEIRAHNGLIRSMKFNATGCYLASGGDDCVVRIWQIREVEASCKCSSAYNSYGIADKVKERKSILERKSIYPASIVIPKKVFMIDEIPLQELYGHTNDVLDLSWTNSNCLLTSSMDKTVRLWKVGCDGCFKLFQHNDYVTCVQFNPVDDKYFISGCIDGKVRVWGVSENHVVAWADTRDIITAVCYRPDGKGFVVGTIMGNCRFYSYSGNAMQLERQLCVQGSKKSVGKSIRSLQFSPEDSRQVMITSADSRVRIFDGVDVVHKFRGLRRSKSQLSASFAADGRYVVSVGEDSNVYVWSYDSSPKRSSSKGTKSKKSVRSCEVFSSEGVSIAIPWCGTNHDNLHLPSQPLKILEPSTWLWDLDLGSLGAWFFADGLSKGSSTWPEEELPASPQPPSKVDKLLRRRFRRLAHLPATWRMVIVTASCDGIIRSFHNYGLPVRPR